MWEAFLLRKNIERFEALLEDENTSEETRKVVAGLLAEARTKFAALGDPGAAKTDGGERVN